MAKEVVNTQIRFDNSSYITYVVKTYSDGTYQFTAYRKVQGCYRLVQKTNGICIRQ